MAHAAGFVLDAEQRLVGVDVDDVEETVLVLVGFLGDQAALEQFLVRAGEVDQGDLDVVAVVFRDRRGGLAVDDAAFGGGSRPGVVAALDRKSVV